MMIPILITAAALVAAQPPTCPASGSSAPVRPTGWQATSRAPTLVRFTLDSTVAHGGCASGRLDVTFGKPSDVSGTASQTIKADAYHNQRVRLTGWLRTTDATSVDAYLRVQGAPGDRVTTFALSNNAKTPITANGEWQRIDQVLDVHGRSRVITIGVTLSGKGTVWLDDFSLEAVDDSVRSTNILTDDLVMLAPREVQDKIRESWETLPAKPVNLDFEGAPAATHP